MLSIYGVPWEPCKAVLSPSWFCAQSNRRVSLKAEGASVRRWFLDEMDIKHGIWLIFVIGGKQFKRLCFLQPWTARPTATHCRRKPPVFYGLSCTKYNSQTQHRGGEKGRMADGQNEEGTGHVIRGGKAWNARKYKLRKVGHADLLWSDIEIISA